MNRDLLKKEMERDEGRILQAYKDTADYWTIGIGHLLGTSPRMSNISDAECDALYAYDIARAEALARELVKVFDALDDARQRALVNMAFNRGNHLRTSEKIMPAILHASSTGDPSDWHAVSEAIAGSQWAAQVGGRATRLGAMFAAGGA